MKSMMLFLLGVRLLFLVLACFGCVFAIISGLRTGVEWYWPAGGVLGLGLCGFLIGQVWASLKATWKQESGEYMREIGAGRTRSRAG